MGIKRGFPAKSEPGRCRNPARLSKFIESRGPGLVEDLQKMRRVAMLSCVTIPLCLRAFGPNWSKRLRVPEEQLRLDVLGLDERPDP